MTKTVGILSATVILALAALLPACATARASQLDHTSWLLESYGKPTSLISIVEGTNVSVDFEGDGVVSGSTGCNAFEGTYKVDGNALTINYEIGSGPRCDLSAIVEQEQMFLVTIILAERFSIEADALTIDCGERILVFRKRVAV